ncbi:hypothetical protein BPTFM16_01895 [Altererythrobacter insulae]|nr:hypothetical protein BPTFM16_01895 [Altererythrobacter insulae]
MKHLALGIALAVAPLTVLNAHHHEGALHVSSDQPAIQQTIDGIYAVISGPVGEQRDWDKMRSLMTRDARLTPIGSEGHRSHDIDGYIERSEQFLMEQGFFEIETGNRMEIYGNLAQVWSAYEGRTGSADGSVFVTGINSFQLVKTGDGWKVFSILWQAANDELPVPADLSTMEAN